ncbi:MAG: flagellar biosynthesis protein FlhF [Lachnospiraceae bacterium]|nr:flagellar biosynthesis protein FlhF [Lachnospiraceae bacterium]
MIIKRFQAKTEDEAKAAAFRELGTNAVIIHVKTTRAKGLFAIFKRPTVEVTATVEEESDNPPVSRMPQNGAYTAPLKAQPQSQPQPVRPTFPGVIPDDEPAEKDDNRDKAPAGADIEAKLENLQSLLEKNLKQEGGHSGEKTTGDDSNIEKNQDTVRFLKLIYGTLVDNEVDERYANEIIGELSDVSRPGLSVDSILAGIYQKMILMFGEADTVKSAANGPMMVYFIGPTGVGKTTTIAKIASDLCLKQKKKVALVTTDTYRIAATDQLRTYADIMGTPFRILYTEKEMADSYEEFKDYDYIMVDTAGHSPKNKDLVDGTRQFLHALDGKAEKEVYLVLSATTKYKDLISIVDMYGQLDDYKLIFTKLDETGQLGNLWNIRMRTKASMSYVTMGQNVPGDIAAFNPQTVVKKLLSEE